MAIDDEKPDPLADNQKWQDAREARQLDQAQRRNKVWEREKKQHDELNASIDKVTPQVHDETPRDWTKETAKGVNLDDAHESGFFDPERDDIRSMENQANVSREYNIKLMEVLRTMAAIQQDAITDLEQLQRYFHRLR